MHAGVFRMRYVSLGAGDEGSGVKSEVDDMCGKCKKSSAVEGI